MVKVGTNFPKFYVCKYGAFYEGQKLSQYIWTGGNNYCYHNSVILDKFIVHYKNSDICMYFSVKELNSKKQWTLPCDGYLGVLYRKN